MQVENGLGFKLSDDGIKLLAVITPCEDRIALTSDIIKQQLEAQQFSHLFINEYSISELIEHYKKNDYKTSEFEIGERRDASCQLYFGSKKMKAFLSLVPSFGGKSITWIDVQKTLQEAGISYGIVSSEAIETVLARGRCEDFLIAQGLEPIAGTDTKFCSLVPAINRNPYVDNQDVVDFRELGDIITVDKDELLMERIPAIKGEIGYNVLGEVIEPSGGIDTPFSDDQRGVYINPEDSNQLLAVMAGQPLLIPNGVAVTAVLTVPEVNLSSGNVRFNGSIVVTGNVEDGMFMHSSEDISIDGDVTNATIECEGNLVIKGCVTGNCELTAGGNIDVDGGVMGYAQKVGRNYHFLGGRETRIQSRGSVRVLFAENFNIEASVDIIITKCSINSQLMAGNKIIIGSKNTNLKSTLIGGMAWAMVLVKTITIGLGSGIKTRVHAGSNPYVQRRMTQIKNDLIQSEKEQKNIHKILAYIANHPEKGDPDMLERLHHTLSKLIIDDEIGNAELKELASKVKDIDNAKIISERHVYVGTEIKINDSRWKADEDRGKSIFTEQKRKISVNTH